MMVLLNFSWTKGKKRKKKRPQMYVVEVKFLDCW